MKIFATVSEKTKQPTNKHLHEKKSHPTHYPSLPLTTQSFFQPPQKNKTAKHIYVFHFCSKVLPHLSKTSKVCCVLSCNKAFTAGSGKALQVPLRCSCSFPRPRPTETGPGGSGSPRSMRWRCGLNSSFTSQVEVPRNGAMASMSLSPQTKNTSYFPTLLNTALFFFIGGPEKNGL